MPSYFVVLIIGFILGIVAGNDNLRHKVRIWLRTHLRRDSEGKMSKAEKARKVKLDDYD